MQDFSTPPLSRALRVPEEANMTAEQRQEAAVKRAWGEELKPESLPSRWAPGAPSDAATLRLLDYPHDPSTGQPLPPKYVRELPELGANVTDAELVAEQGRNYRARMQYLEDSENYQARFRFWVSLCAGGKSQLAAETKWRREDAPLWMCSCTDPIQPPIVLKAADIHQAKARYRALLGIRYIEPARHAQEQDVFFAEPYEPIAAA